jgi:site-specific DNA-methyltransferase (adenine-specific)
MTKGELRQKGNSAKQNGCYNPYKQVKVVNDIYYPKTIISVSGVPNKALNHPTEKPVALEEYLIRTYTNQGDTVLDNCMGSGSTGVAAVLTGRNFIGIEQEQKYYNIAKERIDNV